MITTLLPEPDGTKHNPKCRSAPPTNLYSREKVEAIEASEEFKVRKQTSTRRRGAQKAVQTKQKNMEAFLDDLDFEVPKMEKEELISRACENYNGLNWERLSNTGSCIASKDDPPKFLNRIVVNYVRHCLTRYDGHLAETAGKVGAGDAYFTMKRRVLREIAFVYPWLKDECEKQIEDASAQERYIWVSRNRI
jgi:hypothetical protein